MATPPEQTRGSLKRHRSMELSDGPNDWKSKKRAALVQEVISSNNIITKEDIQPRKVVSISNDEQKLASKAHDQSYETQVMDATNNLCLKRPSLVLI